MPRSCSPDIMLDWKIPIRATLAGAVEARLFNPLTGKPIYGARSKLIDHLLSRWVAEMGGKIDIEPLPEILTPKGAKE